MATSEDGEAWNAHHALMREKKQGNREYGAAFLDECGFLYEVKNRGTHIILTVQDIRFDYWPGTGKWVESLNYKRPRRGIRSLFDRLVHLEASI